MPLGHEDVEIERSQQQEHAPAGLLENRKVASSVYAALWSLLVCPVLLGIHHELQLPSNWQLSNK